MIRPATPRLMLATVAALALTGCTTSEFDWDLRPDSLGSTAEAALTATRERPAPDSRGVLSYPGYQVALARRGDTVGSVAARLGIDPGELARANALQPGDSLREGEILALPRRVAEPLPGGPGSGTTGAIVGGPVTTGPIDVTTLAGTAIDRAAPTASSPAPAAPPAGPEPVRHRVQRGETAFSIARTYGVSAKALADWNGLGPEMSLREGQTLLIPTAAPGAAPAPAPKATEPGTGSPTPVPPSAAKPLPDEKPLAANAPTPGTPPSPDLGQDRTRAAAMAMPVSGKIIRGYSKGKNDGIDIAAAPGTPVKAAADGTVAAITKDTNQVPIVVIKHPDNLLTVYAGIDAVSVTKGATVKRGQQIAVIRQANPAFLHFEVRRGVDSVDPVGFLQ
jgi:murein DD-endopeptidase MepM/ murein hydrolase activator NlpD